MNTETDIVRAHSAESANAAIDSDMTNTVAQMAARPAAIAGRIEKLEREWDVERILEMNASTLAFAGLLLGVFVHPYWLFLPGIVLPFLFLHAVQGWCPPLPVLRYFKVRTRKELDIEKFALKALRGDFAVGDTPGAALAASRKN